MTKEEEEQKNLQEIGQILTFMMNNQAVDDFEGYSPGEMQHILYDPFGKESPVQFYENIPDEIIDQIPMLRIMEYIMKKVEEAGELKLTVTGALPRSIVMDLYGRFYKDDLIEKYGYKLYKETDSYSIHIAHVVLGISKLVKKSNNKLSLTKKGKTLMKDRQELLKEIFRNYTQKYRIAYLDGHSSDDCAQLGFAFTLILLAKYGESLNQTTFYAEKYLKAFPRIIDSFKESYTPPSRQMSSCYAFRSFNKFLNFFNLTELETSPDWDEPDRVKKSAIFDRIFRIVPSNASGKMN